LTNLHNSRGNESGLSQVQVKSKVKKVNLSKDTSSTQRFEGNSSIAKNSLNKVTKLHIKNAENMGSSEAMDLSLRIFDPA
jgi:hypothetical protein